MPYADTEESPMHPEKLLAGVAMAAMLACLAIAVVGRILGEIS
jgi:TRAP-type C4-dicarboxylate transport system permease small subunit